MSQILSNDGAIIGFSGYKLDNGPVTLQLGVRFADGKKAGLNLEKVHEALEKLGENVVVRPFYEGGEGRAPRAEIRVVAAKKGLKVSMSGDDRKPTKAGDFVRNAKFEMDIAILKQLVSGTIEYAKAVPRAAVADENLISFDD